MKRVLLLSVLLAVLPAWGDQKLRRIAGIDHPPMSEVSGLARSSQPGVFWAHNDSGDEARIFAITLDGKPVIPGYLARRYSDGSWPGLRILNAWNFDWEDMAAANDTLYLADVGNNSNARRDMGVYYLPEPNPFAVPEARALGFLPVRYPDQDAFPATEWHFDCEAVFVADGKLHFLTKHREPGQQEGWQPGTKLYRLDTHHTDRDNVLTLVSKRDDVVLPTAAELSPDGSRLAVLTYVAIWIFARPADGENWLSSPTHTIPISRLQTKIVEAVAWRDDNTLLVANENRDLFEMNLAPK
ncbi:MAG: hypothetical protein HC809_04795 [Gammaproteobacteria bacterium]|nr:hypothetical protein [Gammaproteobacteria bacterium]